MVNKDHRDHTELEDHTAQLVHNVCSTELERMDNMIHTRAIHMGKGESKVCMVRRDHRVKISMVHIPFRTVHTMRVYMVPMALLSHTAHNLLRRRALHRVHKVHKLHAARKVPGGYMVHKGRSESHIQDIDWWRNKAVGNTLHLVHLVQLDTEDKQHLAYSL